MSSTGEPSRPTPKQTRGSEPSLVKPKGHETMRATPAPTPSPTRTKTTPAVPAEVAGAKPDARFGKFVLIKKLGAGGMGEVWKAWDGSLSRYVAIKFLKGGDEDVEIARFEREARTAAGLQHPNIAAIHEVGCEAAKHYIAMQFVDGQTLKSHSKSKRETFVTLMRFAARAVAYAHGQGIVHRDLKPENIMVDVGGRVYVMDFGLARPMEQDSDVSQPGTIVGTPSYMSPEQARGETVDGRADVYSLGATLYDLLTRRPPFKGGNIYETLRLLQDQDPVPPRKHDRTIDADLETIVMKCLQKDPEQRYATAADLEADLARWLDGSPIQAHPPSMSYRLKKFVVRRRAVILPTIVAMVVVAVAAVWTVRSSQAKARDVEALVGQAAALEREGKEAEARDRYQAALAIAPDHAAAKAAFAKLDGVLRRRDEDRQESLRLIEAGRPALDKAVQYLYRSDADYAELVRRVEAARGILEQAREKAPSNPLVHHLIGQSWEIEGWTDRAEAAYRKAVGFDPKFAAAHYRLGRLLVSKAFMTGTWSLRDNKERRRVQAEIAARAAAESMRLAVNGGLDDAGPRRLAEIVVAVVSDPDHGRVLAEAAARDFAGKEGEEDFYWIAGVMLGDLHGSLEWYDRALKVRPRHIEALFCRGLLLKVGGRSEAAIRDLDELIKISPRFPDAYINRGNAKQDLGNLDGAIADYGEVMRLAPEMGEAWLNRAIARRLKKDLAGAMEDAEKAVAMNREDSDGYTIRATLKADLGDPKGAVADFEQAQRLDPKNTTAWYNGANSRMDLNDWEGAVRDFTKAIETNPKHAESYANRGASNEMLKRIDDAVDDYEAALRIAPKNWRYRNAVEERLRALGK